MRKSVKEVGVGFCCRWVVNAWCLFGRLDIARLGPEPSVATRLDPRQHFFDVALLVGEVAETVFLEEPAKAALTPALPLGALVDLLACEV